MSAFFNDVAAAWESAREAARIRLAAEAANSDPIEVFADVTPTTVLTQGGPNVE